MFSAFLLLSFLPSFSAQDTPPDPPQGLVTDYAPQTNVECPDISRAPLIREWTSQNQSLHPQEEEYLNRRAAEVLPHAWGDWLGNGSRMGYDLSAQNFSWPKLGCALPGGGLRAALFAAGSLSGLDARNETAKKAGTGGLLQVASYISSLSGLCYLLSLTCAP
jgi:lysophospholipase